MNHRTIQDQIDAIYRKACDRLDHIDRFEPENIVARNVAVDAVIELTEIASAKAMIEHDSRREQKAERQTGGDSLVVQRKPGESVDVDGPARITIHKASGRVNLRFSNCVGTRITRCDGGGE